MKYALIFIASLAVCATATAQQTVEELNTLALEKAHAKDYNYAATLLERSLALDSLETNTWQIYAEVLSEQSDLNGAYAAYRRALAIDSTDADIYNRVGILFRSYGLRDYALEAYGNAIRLARTDTMRASFLSNRAGVYHATQDWDLALADQRAALELFPEATAAINNMAVTYMRMGRNEEGAEMLRKLTRVEGSERMAYSNLALVYTRMGRPAAAIAYFDTAYQYLDTLNDAEMGLHFSNYSEAQYRLRNYEAALASINRSIARYPANSYAYRTLALIYLGMEMPHEACRALDFAAERDFGQQYGPEVSELQAEHCGAAGAGAGGGR